MGGAHYVCKYGNTPAITSVSARPPDPPVGGAEGAPLRAKRALSGSSRAATEARSRKNTVVRGVTLNRVRCVPCTLRTF